MLQLESSSCAIHGGAYFWALSGRKFNLTSVLRPCRPLACCLIFFPPSVTFVLDVTDLPSPRGLARYLARWIGLQNAKMDSFPTALTVFPKTNFDFTDCCMNLFSTMLKFLRKYDR